MNTLFRILVGVTLGMFALSSFTSDGRLWGVNHLAFYPLPVRILALAVMLLALLPRVRLAVAAAARNLARRFERRPRLFAAFASVACLALFLVFSAATRLLGDGNYVLNFMRDAAGADPAGFAHYLRTLHPAFAGTDLLYTVLGRVAARAFGLDALVVIRFLVSLIGALLAFPFAAWLLRGLPGAPLIDRAMALLAATSGALMLFFGYIEVYVPFCAVTALYLASAWSVIHRSGPLWRPVVFALAAGVLHTLGILLLPSLMFLTVFVARGRRASPRVLTLARVLALLMLPLPWLVCLVPRLQHLVRPLAGDRTAVFGGFHLVNFVNELLLVCPVLLVIGGVALFARVRSKEEHAAPLPDPAESAFVVLLLAPALVFLIAFRSDIGMARDWDLFAPVSLAVVGLVWYALRRSPEAIRVLTTNGAAVQLIVISATMTAAWVGVNASGDRSVARYRIIMTRDAIDTAYAYEQIATYYHDRGDLHGEIAMLEQAVRTTPNPRYHFWLGMRYYAVGEREKGVAEMQRCLHSRPDYPNARLMLVQALYYMDRTAELTRACDDGTLLEPDNPLYPFLKGKGLAKAGETREAMDALAAARRLNPPPAMEQEIVSLMNALEQSR